MRIEDCYLLGKITRKHGLAGNVLLKLDTDQPEFYKKLESIFVEINGLLVPFFIEKSAKSKVDTFIVSFKNSSEMLVEQSVGKNVYLPLTTLPKLTGNQFYYHEIIGFTIIDQNEVDFGVIRSVNDQTAQNYFVTNLNGKEVVIPIIKDWILKVDRDQRTIKIELPEGLLDVFLTVSKKDE